MIMISAVLIYSAGVEAVGTSCSAFEPKTSFEHGAIRSARKVLCSGMRIEPPRFDGLGPGVQVAVAHLVPHVHNYGLAVEVAGRSSNK